MLGLVRFVARSLLAAIFVFSGVRAVRDPSSQVERAQAALPGVPHMHLIARAQGALQAVAGTTMMLGVSPGASATALAGTLIPVTYVGHAFWKEESEQSRKMHQIHFLKNVAMFGGLVFVALEERARHAAERCS